MVFFLPKMRRLIQLMQEADTSKLESRRPQMRIFLCFDCHKKDIVTVVGCGTAVPNKNCDVCNKERCPKCNQPCDIVIIEKWRCNVCEEERYAMGC
jgi:hypothetical protein